MVINVKSSNYLLANFISQIFLGSKRRLRFIIVPYNKMAFDIIKILYKEGLIKLFIIQKKEQSIRIYFKYYNNLPMLKYKIISKPSKRVYWDLSKLSTIYNNSNFIGFYIISTPYGLLTSHECLLHRHISGEVLIKIYI